MWKRFSLQLCGKRRIVENMTSIQVLEANAGKSNQNEAAAAVLIRARKHVSEPLAVLRIDCLIEDLMYGRKSSIRRQPAL